MYSKGNGKGAKHEWVPSINNLGLASYIYVRKFAPLAGHTLFTSLTCQELSSPSFLQIPRSHLLLSLASYSVSRAAQPIMANGSSFSMVTLCPASSLLFSTISGHQDALYESVKVLKFLMASKDGGKARLAPVGGGESESEAAE
jgi:hypothetical protein